MPSGPVVIGFILMVIGALVLLGLWQLVASKLRGVVGPVVLMTAGW